jgi:hypothetical protein
VSTRMSVMDKPPVHVYVELTTDWVRLELGEWCDIGLYKRPRGWRGRLGRFACWIGQHDWFLDVPFWTRTDGGQTTYVCLRCEVKS